LSAIDVAQALFGVGRSSPNPTRILLYLDDKCKSLFKLHSVSHLTRIRKNDTFFSQTKKWTHANAYAM